MPEQPKEPPKNFFRRLTSRGFPLWLLPIMILLLWMWNDPQEMNAKSIPYSEFKDYVARKEVAQCEIRPDEIRGVIQPKPADPDAKQPGGAPAGTFKFRTVRVDDPKLVKQLQDAGVQYTGARPSIMNELVWAWLLPIALMIFFWTFIIRGLGKAREGVFGFGKSRAKLVADKSTGVTFADVAGCDEAKYELQEIVDFLKNPDRYRALGAVIPKGVLLSGPPGTGKTLLARAVAGEAGVPFFSLSGSEFVEMFVGVGASRVRDLFQQAKAQAPCIVFIDELDAIGRQRGVHIGAVNDEREQTLNQLLVEMDGFEANAGVIVLGATNRPEVLDRALLRPGRFDRQVVIDAPDLNGREAILRIHSRGKPLADNIDLHKIAQRTPGFSGADLANAMNEAALLAARRGVPRIGQQDLEEAIEKVTAGPERKSLRLVEETKRRVAYHEVGHALVAAYSQYADPVHKISVVPRGRAAGYTLLLPADDQFIVTRSSLIDKIKGLLGGRAAEEVVYREVSTGDENDLERATALVRNMICLYGMNDRLGLVHCGQRQNPFLAGPAEAPVQRDCSELTAREIDEEVKKMLGDAYGEAKQILLDHRDQLERVTQELLKKETLDAQEFNALLGRDAVPAEVNGRVASPAGNGELQSPLDAR